MPESQRFTQCPTSLSFFLSIFFPPLNLRAQFLNLRSQTESHCLARLSPIYAHLANFAAPIAVDFFRFHRYWAIALTFPKLCSLPTSPGRDCRPGYPLSWVCNRSRKRAVPSKELLHRDCHDSGDSQPRQQCVCRHAHPPARMEPIAIHFLWF